MALFRKTIVGPGVYSVRTSKGRVLVPVTRQRIRDICNTANEMIQEGFKIPCPYAHRDENEIVPSVVMSDEEIDLQTKEKKKWSSDINAGFWKTFDIDEKGRLEGVVEVPGSEDDPKSPAYKFGKTIQETSIFYEPKYIDGFGKEWRHALRHVAAVLNPREPGQSNFEAIPETPEYELAMSFSMSDEVAATDKTGVTPKSDAADSAPETKEKPEPNISEIVRLFKEKFKLEFPTDTTFENFIDRLRTILFSLPTEEEEELASDKPKEKSDPKTPVSIAMADEPVIPKKFNKMLEDYFNQLKKALKERIEIAVQNGKIGKRYAEQVFYPELEAFAMSEDDFDDEGNRKKSDFEIRLEMAEQLDAILDKAISDTPSGDTEEVKPSGEEVKASQDELDGVYRMANY